MNDQAPGQKSGKPQFAYVGCYTRRPPGGGGRVTPVGVSVFAVDAATGDLSPIQTVPSENPSFLAFHPTGRFLYGVCEIDDYEGRSFGAVEGYAIDPTSGELTLLNRQSSYGAATTHLAVDRAGRYVAVASYSGSTFAIFPLEDDGSLAPASDVIEQTGSGPNQARQEKPHPHGVAFDPIGNHLVTADLGIDKVQVFRIDEVGKAVATSVAATEPGAGPRHLTISADGRFVYVINEMHATISVFPFDGTSGRISPAIQTISTVPDDFAGLKSTAEIVLHPSGRFLYGSNRGGREPRSPVADSVAVFAVDPVTGRLTPLGHTAAGIDEPRHFMVDPSGAWLYVCNQHADTIARFAIDRATGALNPTGWTIESPTPVCLVFSTA
jgi:6-phosphogluconolactonase (cycloisomerase 2 family)